MSYEFVGLSIQALQASNQVHQEPAQAKEAARAHLWLEMVHQRANLKSLAIA